MRKDSWRSNTVSKLTSGLTSFWAEEDSKWAAPEVRMNARCICSCLGVHWSYARQTSCLQTESPHGHMEGVVVIIVRSVWYLEIGVETDVNWKSSELLESNSCPNLLWSTFGVVRHALD